MVKHELSDPWRKFWNSMRDRELVLLHGQPGSRADWLGVLETLPVSAHAVAIDRPGYGASEQPPGGFTANARAVLAGMDARGTDSAVLVGHSYGGGVALATAALAPERVEALVLVASVGPDCLTALDYLLGAPIVGELMSIAAFWLTPPFARARLAFAERRRGTPLRPQDHASLQVWGRTTSDHGSLWRTFLVEQRALVDELDELVASLNSIIAPALLVADPSDGVVPVRTTHALCAALPDTQLIEVHDVGHHIPRMRAADLAGEITRFLVALDERPADQASA